MAHSELAAQRFVRALLPDHRAWPEDGGYVVERADRIARLPATEAGRLLDMGLLEIDGSALRATLAARDWLRRRQSSAEPTIARHAQLAIAPDGTLRNLGESPLARLANAAAGQSPFLSPHHVEAGERIRRLAERAQMIQRTTMSYDPARAAPNGNGRAPGGQVADTAIDARRRLADLLGTLPRDCAGVVLDVCGLMKGLQTVEAERGWPRRSAKLVLRIGLEQLAARLGLSPQAQGPSRGRVGGWFEERPTRFE